MTGRIARRLDDESGMAAAMAVIALGIMLIAAAGVFAQAVLVNDTAGKDDSGRRAFQAAEAGLNVATQRLTAYQPGATSCQTTTTDVDSGGGWCTSTWEWVDSSDAGASSAVGRRGQFRYFVSKPLAVGSGCWAPVYAGVSERCVVAVGKVSGQTRRVEARVAVAGAAALFANGTGLIGLRKVELKQDSEVVGNITTNREFKCHPSSVLTGGSVLLPPKAKKKGSCSFPTTAIPTPNLVAPPNFGNTATVNNNSVFTCAAPGSCAGTVTYDAAKRSLKLEKNARLILTGGVFNLCELEMKEGAKIEITGQVRLYMDSDKRKGSGCSSGRFSVDARAEFDNKTLNPENFVIYGWTTKMTLPVKKPLYAVVHAPYAKIKAKSDKSPGSMVGGIVGKEIKIDKRVDFSWSDQLADFQPDVVPSYQRIGWRQCRSQEPTTGAPDQSCVG